MWLIARNFRSKRSMVTGLLAHHHLSSSGGEQRTNLLQRCYGHLYRRTCEINVGWNVELEYEMHLHVLTEYSVYLFA